MIRILISGLLLVFCMSINAQKTPDEDEYFKEFIWGVNKNTRSGLIGGFFLMHSRRQTGNRYETFGLELLNVKHPKEQRYRSEQQATSFIWAKQNYLYSIRTHYGLSKIIYRKAPQQGVQISAGVAAGPSIGVVSPYYITTHSQRTIPYTPTTVTSVEDVAGPGRIFQGLGESSLVPGFNGRASLSFEFGAFRNSVTGLELGVSLEQYIKKIIIMPTQDNTSTYGTTFITLYWGTRK